MVTDPVPKEAQGKSVTDIVTITGENYNNLFNLCFIKRFMIPILYSLFLERLCEIKYVYTGSTISEASIV